MINLRIGEILGNDDGRERVLWLHPEGRGAWLIGIDGKAASPFLRAMPDIDGLLEEGLLKPVTDPWVSPKTCAHFEKLRFGSRPSSWCNFPDGLRS